MNALQGDQSVQLADVQDAVGQYDATIARGRSLMNDEQLRRIAELRQYRGDRIRLCKFQPINDSRALPLIAVREFIISRKSLGGIRTALCIAGCLTPPDGRSRVSMRSEKRRLRWWRHARDARSGGHVPRRLRSFRPHCGRGDRRTKLISERGRNDMKRTGAWLAVYALEQIGARFAFGIPGVQTTELYDEMNNSNRITPVLVTHEGGGSFMADAISRLSDSIGVLTVVPAAGLTHASSGIGEAFLDGVPMLVISGGPRTDTGHQYQLHQMDTHKFMGGLTKATFRITRHDEVVPTLFEAFRVATGGEPGPVFVELPVNVMLLTEEIGELQGLSAASAGAGSRAGGACACGRVAGPVEAPVHLCRLGRAGCDRGDGRSRRMARCTRGDDLAGPVGLPRQSSSACRLRLRRIRGARGAESLQGCDCMIAIGHALLGNRHRQLRREGARKT